METRKNVTYLLGFILLIVFCSGIYFLLYDNSEDMPEQEISSPSNISFTPLENSVSVMDGDTVIQTLSLDEEALAALTLELPYINDQKFLLDQDVNFDGNKDVALMTGVGYGGVNIFYDYYIYNPTTRRLEKSEILTGISNPEVDTAAKKITASFRSGPQWYTQSFQWNGSTHIESEKVPEENL